MKALRFELSGCWSCRITAEHRFVYEVAEDHIRVFAGRFQYR